MWGNNNLGLAYLCKWSKIKLENYSKTQRSKTCDLKNVCDNNVKLHTFVSDEKSNLKITSKFKGTKLVISKNVGQQQCSMICQFKKKPQHELKN
jgi:hypothetical protein